MSTEVAIPAAEALSLTHLTSSGISIEGRHFVDENGRVLHLRGANVGASSKVPVKPIPKIHDHRDANYLGRPFPLEEAGEHWRRLKSWGLTFIRLNVTWDAIEHAGPGAYDEEYLSYLRSLLESMREYGLVAYIGIHQDVWSRYSGGSGAPGWPLEAAGFDLSNEGEALALSGAAFLDGIKGGRLSGERGLWPTGYQKLAATTMSTLFWGGETFAPAFTVPSSSSNGNSQRKNVDIQTYLQDAFLAAFGKLVDAVGDVESVVGFELMNEPHPGFIGLPSIHEWDYNTDLHLGEYPSPLQSFSMGAGHPTPSVPVYTRSFPYPTRITKSVTGNATGAKAWKSGECPWEKEGVWRWSDAKSQAIALQEDYFSKDRKGSKVDFYQDFYFPFVRKWEDLLAKKLSSKSLKARMVGPVPNEFAPEWDVASRPSSFVYAPHWYDLNALFKKRFGWMTVNVQGLSRGMFILKALYFGEEGAKANYALQILNHVLESRRKLGQVPVVFGECGVPMDLNGEKALKSGNWKWQERAMDALISAMESSLVAFNLWTYNPSNRDDIGDDWNAENFSWFSEDNRSKALKKAEDSNDLDAGGRLLDVIVRPYAIATAGTPISHAYDRASRTFTYRYRSAIRLQTGADSTAPEKAEITEIFLPRRVYQEGQITWSLSTGGRCKFDWEQERLFVWFEDTPLSLSNSRGESEKVRRVDIWVPASENKKWSILQIILTSLAALLLLGSMWWIQNYQWEKERSLHMFGKTARKLR